MVDVLECGKCIPKETVDVLREIKSAFILEFEKIDNSVWTHEAMKRSDFVSAWHKICYTLATIPASVPRPNPM